MLFSFSRCFSAITPHSFLFSRNLLIKLVFWLNCHKSTISITRITLSTSIQPRQLLMQLNNWQGKSNFVSLTVLKPTLVCKWVTDCTTIVKLRGTHFCVPMSCKRLEQITFSVQQFCLRWPRSCNEGRQMHSKRSFHRHESSQSRQISPKLWIIVSVDPTCWS